MLILARAALAIGVSISALLISLALDRLLAPLSLIPQFLIQIPALVLTMEYIRTLTIRRITNKYNLSADDVNGAFFFAAPLAAVASSDLIRKIREQIA
jgi:hypothetical protein